MRLFSMGKALIQAGRAQAPVYYQFVRRDGVTSMAMTHKVMCIDLMSATTCYVRDSNSIKKVS